MLSFDANWEGLLKVMFWNFASSLLEALSDRTCPAKRCREGTWDHKKSRREAAARRALDWRGYRARKTLVTFKVHEILTGLLVLASINPAKGEDKPNGHSPRAGTGRAPDTYRAQLTFAYGNGSGEHGALDLAL
jgi:hypothetical protein